MTEGEEYKVGYGKPPKASQFKKGTSGNPKGRPTGARGLRVDLKEELSERVTVQENGRSIRLSKQRLMIKQLTTQALKGDMRAIHRLADLTLKVLGADEEAAQSERKLAAEDAEILRAYTQRLSQGETNDQ